MIGEVLFVMKALAHSGITMIVVTHEMQFAREIADRIVFIDGGQILETAPPAQFSASQRIRARSGSCKGAGPAASGASVMPALDWQGY